MDRSIYAGGYTEARRQKLEATKLPEKIRCKQCEKLKPTNVGYSKRQLNNLRQKVAYNYRLLEGNVPSPIACRQCTDPQNTEMKCVGCGQVKSLEGFTKAQRRNPDQARCYQCVNGNSVFRLAGDLRPVGDSSSEESDDEDDGNDSRDGSASIAETNLHAASYASGSEDDDNSTMQDGMVGLTLSEKNRQTGSPLATADSRIAHWKEHAKAQYDPSDVSNQKAPKTYTAYDSTGKAHQRVHRPSSVASGYSPPQTTSSIAPRQKFAKIKTPAPSSSRLTEKKAKVYKNVIMTVPEAAKNAVGRQREDSDSGSDSDFGRI